MVCKYWSFGIVLLLLLVDQGGVLLKQVDDLLNHPRLWRCTAIVAVPDRCLVVQMGLWIQRIVANSVLSQIELVLLNFEWVLPPQLTNYLAVDDLQQCFDA